MIFLRRNIFDCKSFSECEGQQTYSNSVNIINTSPILYLIYFLKLQDYKKPESSYIRIDHLQPYTELFT